MPIYEYLCQDCGKKSEILIRNSEQKPECECGSQKMEKVLSAFAVNSHSQASGCASGACSLPQSPCASGMCGLS